MEIQGTSDSGTIFISYGRGDDEAFVCQLYEHLIQQSYHVWWDRSAMNSRGRTFLQEIRDAITSVERVLLVVGPEASRSPYVKAEWEFALNSCKVIIPILRLGDYGLIPKPLSKFHCTDFRVERPYSDALEELTRILRQQVPKLAAMYGVDALPPHFLARPTESQRLLKAMLADVLNPVAPPPAKRTTALLGMGGAGKSVLAASLVRSCDVRRVFPDGIVWIRMGRGNGALEAFRLLGWALGDDALYHAPDRQSGALRLPVALQEKACMIVLDDVWDLDVAELFYNAMAPDAVNC